MQKHSIMGEQTQQVPWPQWRLVVVRLEEQLNIIPSFLAEDILPSTHAFLCFQICYKIGYSKCLITHQGKKEEAHDPETL